jgi:hypothetical protein
MGMSPLDGMFKIYSSRVPDDDDDAEDIDVAELCYSEGKK